MFWERIMQLCNKNGISASKLCEIIGLSNATATKWKNGSIPQNRTLKKIADYFNVSTDYLLGKTDIQNPSSADGNITFDDFTYAMYNESKYLTEEDKQALLNMAALLKKKKQTDSE